MKLLITVTLVPILIILLDLLWFSFSGNFFKNEISNIARLTPAGEWNVQYLAALAVYLAMALGLYFFVLPKATDLGSALLWGGLFGFVMYSIFDFTNLAILKDWTINFALVDIAWGTVLCATVTACLYYTFELIG